MNLKTLENNSASSFYFNLEEDGKKLSLNLATSKLAIKENDHSYKELDVDFETFIREPRNYNY